MTLQAFPGPGPWWPQCWPWVPGSSASTGMSFSNAHTMDAVDERMAMMGTVFIEGRPGSSKTISSSGGKIHWRAGSAITFANAGTTLRVGLRPVSASAGQAMQPDESGAMDVYDDLVGATDTITANAWTTTTMSSGTKTISHGDQVAITWHMTARGGADSVTVSALNGVSTYDPQINTFVSAWGTSAAAFLPIALIEFDDGTFGVLGDSPPFSAFTQQTYNDGSATDEYGLIFQVQSEIKIDALGAMIHGVGTAADFTIAIYSDPLGSPTSMASVTVLGEHTPTTGSPRIGKWPITEQTLSAGTDYCIAIKATGASNLGLSYASVANANHRKFVTGTTNMRKASRNGGSGAFGTEVTTDIPMIGFRLSAIHDGAGGGGGGLLVHPGMRGGFL